MPGPRPDAYALLESSFQASPNLRSHKQFPRRRDDYRSLHPTAEPLKQSVSHPDDETDPHISSQHPTPVASPGIVNGADTGLPPTPPSNSQDGLPESDFSPPPHADGVVASLISKKSALSTPVNQRSPPTPDPSPPRTTESMSTPDRPLLFAYPSSRAESFKTAREDQFSSEGGSRSATPLAARLSTVEEDRGLGLAFERDDNDPTSTNRIQNTYAGHDAMPRESEESRDTPEVEDIPNREWDTNLMRNVTVRRKRNPKPSPQRNPDAIETASRATGSTPRRDSSLRERVEASRDSPHTPSIETFAKSIGWPTEEKDTPNGGPVDADQKRLSGSSMSSTVVEAMVIVTPPQRRRMLRHSGKNLAYRRDTDSPSEQSSATYSNRNSMHSEDIPLHRLVHKRASISNRVRRISTDSDTLRDRTASPLSIRLRGQDRAASTLAHQESVRRVLQPAAEILSRSNSIRRSTLPEISYHKRISSAPEPTSRREVLPPEPLSPKPRTYFEEVSPPDSPSPKKQRKASSQLPRIQQTSPSTTSSVPLDASPTSLKLTSPTFMLQEPREQREAPSRLPQIEQTPPSASGFGPPEASPTSPKMTIPTHTLQEPRSPFNINKSLPDLPIELPIQSTNELPPLEEDTAREIEPNEENRPPSALLDHVRTLLADQEATQPSSSEHPQPQVSPRPRASSAETAPTIRRGSLSMRGRSEERRRSSHSQDRTSTSLDTLLRPSLDRVPTEELSRHSHDWHSFHADDQGRVSFDRSTIRTEEHAMARHLFAQTTPFSQFSDTPIEVSEATAVSIYPHNNHSLLVVQQVARPSQAFEQQQLAGHAHFGPTHPQEPEAPPTPPFVDASDGLQNQLPKPTLTFEPSTPPMQVALPVPGAVDSPLKNPRKPPEPPVIKFIPPTPMEELERQLQPDPPAPPGPPKRSDSHPQRRLSLKQRARRYSDNLISPFLARASSMRGRHASESHAGHENPHIPTVNDEDGSLHPFWRPRGFWDGFEDSDSDSDDNLPPGGDTSDIEDVEPEPPGPRKLGTLGRRLTNGFKRSEGFLIGNSLGVERSGTNKRRPHIELPLRRPSKSRSKSPKVLIQPPTLPMRSHSPRIEKRSSTGSVRSSGVRSSGSYERPRRGSRREAWKQGKNLSVPGLGKGVQVQYIGLSGVKDRFREKKAEKRRESIRRSIGTRYYVEPANTTAS